MGSGSFNKERPARRVPVAYGEDDQQSPERGLGPKQWQTEMASFLGVFSE